MKDNIKSAEELADEISDVMYTQLNNNIHKNKGTAYVDGTDTDVINPKLHLDKAGIRKETGRKIVRGAYIDELSSKLKNKGLQVKKDENGGITIKTKTPTDSENKFSSLSDVRENIESEFDENPEYKKPYYE